MFVKVIFHGILKKICPDEYEVDAVTPAEAIRAVTNQFRNKLIRKDGQRFFCSIKECPRDVDLNSCLHTEELNIFPSFCAGGGGNKSGVMTIIVGAVIAVVGAVMVGVGVFTGNAGLISAGLEVTFYGKMMMLGGALSYFLSPKLDTAHSSDNPESSRAFGNSGNTTKIGTRIPIGYGRYKVAGHYLSINTSTIDTMSGSPVKVVKTPEEIKKEIIASKTSRIRFRLNGTDWRIG